MPWYIYSLARGSVFFWGCYALVTSEALHKWGAGRTARILYVAAFVTSLALIAISATPLRFWIYGIWAAVTLARIAMPLSKKTRIASKLSVLLCLVTATAAYLEFTHTIRPSPPSGSFQRLYVIGDSISAGLGQEHGKTWPVLIAAEHHVNVVDLSHAGATIAEAHKRLDQATLSDGLVFLEIGGNDMLGRMNPAQFENDLESLVKRAEGPGRQLVMLELPLLPFDNAYGIAQRRISRKHHITLIPKRFFVDVLQTPGATVDGIHLSAAGQRQLAEIIWTFIGNSLRQDPSTTLPAS